MRNIHISNGSGYFPFYAEFSFLYNRPIFYRRNAFHWRHRFTHSPNFGGFCIALQFVLDWFACFVCLLRSPLLQFLWGLCYSSFMFVLHLFTNVICGSLAYPGFYVIVLVLYTLYCFIICLYVLSFMMRNPQRFPHKAMLCSCLPPLACMTGVVWFFLYICLCLRITVSNASWLYI